MSGTPLQLALYLCASDAFDGCLGLPERRCFSQGIDCFGLDALYKNLTGWNVMD
jgi:hypothetical protein